jgi:hypothetical protein
VNWANQGAEGEVCKAALKVSYDSERGVIKCFENKHQESYYPECCFKNSIVLRLNSSTFSYIGA